MSDDYQRLSSLFLMVLHFIYLFVCL